MSALIDHDDEPDLDVIVVGGRVAGAATALLLARRGWRVQVIERAERGADTLSTHALMKGGVLQLHRWGLLDAVCQAGTPPIRRTTFHFGDESLVLPAKPVGGVDALYAPRRTVLDPILSDAAAAAGADVRFGTTVVGLLRDGDGRVRGVSTREADGSTHDVSARLVVGADGVRSLVAHSVDAPVTHRVEHAGSFAYAYFGTERDAFDGYQWCYRPGASAGVIPTNGGVLAWIGVPCDRFDREVRGRFDGAFWHLIEATAPEMHGRLLAAPRTSRYRATRGRPSYVRRSSGPGWALVGDAAHFTDPLSAHGLTDALRDAELLARAVHDGLEDPSSMVEALTRYERRRDAISLPLLAATDAIASYAWSMVEIREYLLALSDAMRDEVAVLMRLEETDRSDPGSWVAHDRRAVVDAPSTRECARRDLNPHVLADTGT
jgi:2-polyprenyl-6-methoxyphenol hydroxylase-like FAD-dependent oxidoreductase